MRIGMGMALTSAIRSALGIAPGDSTGGTPDPLTDVLALYANGEEGALYYFTEDFAGLYQDASGTTPVTAVGQPVGLMLDRKFGLVRGPELITGDSSTFTNSVGGWNPTGDATLVAEGGRLKITAGSTGVGAFLTIPTVVGRTYEFRVNAYSGTGPSRFYAGTGAGTSSYISPVQGGAIGFVAVFTATTATAYFILQTRATVTGGETAFFDDVRLRELPGNHASQPTTTARPMLSARKNLLIYSEDFTNAIWGKQNGGMADNTFTGGPSAGGVQRIGQIIQTGTAPTTTSYRVKAGTQRFVQLYVVNDGLPYVNFDLTAGTCAAYGGASGAIQSVGDGWYDISMSCASTSSTAAYGYMVFADSLAHARAAVASVAVSATIHLARAQLEWGLISTRYQRVTSATDYDWKGFPLYLAFDGVDDWLDFGNLSASTVTGLYDAAVRVGPGMLLSRASAGQDYLGVVDDLPGAADINVGTPSYSVNGQGIMRGREFLGAAWPSTVPAVVSAMGFVPGALNTTRTGVYTNYSGYRRMYARALSISLTEAQRRSLHTFLASRAGITLPGGVAA